MSEAEIEAAIRDAAQYAGEDRLYREAMTVYHEAQELLAKVEQAVSAEKKQLEKAERKQIKEECSALKKQIAKKKPETMTMEDVAMLRAAMQELQAKASVLRMEA